jgi:hypothetical protein
MKTEGQSGAGNVLDFALEAFSAPSEEELYPVVQNASAEQIGTVLEQYRVWASTAIVRAPRLAEGELRPYFVTSSGLAAWARGGLDNRNGFKDQTEIWAAVDSIKYRLLYCHSVAIDDAFGNLLDRNLREKTDDVRNRLLNYVAFLLHMGPLLRGNILCLVTSDLYLPREKGSVSHWTALKDRLLGELRAGDVWKQLDIGEISRQAPPDVRKTWEKELRDPVSETSVRMANFLGSCERIARALAASFNAQDRITTYLPFRYDVDLLTAFQQSVRENGRSILSRMNLPDYDNWLLSRLIDIYLPGIDKLEPSQLVQIRTGSSEFAEWRAALADAVRYVDSVPQNIWGRPEAVRKEVVDRLQQGKARLEESLPKATFRKALTSGTVAMVGGAIATGLSVLVDPTMTTVAILAALTAGVAAPAFVAVADAAEGKSNQAKRAARAHYLALLR